MEADVRAITSGPRVSGRVAKRAKTSADYDRTTVTARNELDTRADTIVAGINFRLVEDTGTTCSVSGFYEEFQTLKGIPVATVATAWTDERGLVHILIIHEALYFGEKLDHSLINPNQIRMNGIPVCDDPFDPSRTLGIEYKSDEQDIRIPFTCEGATVLFRSRFPTDEEMWDCPKIVLTSESTWEPSTVNMQGKRMPVEVSNVLTSKADARGLGDEFYVQHDLHGRMVRMAEVNRCDDDPPRQAQSVYSDSRHSEVGTKRIMQVFGVNAPKAKDIALTTTQGRLRTAHYPITRRYRARKRSRIF